MNTDPLLTQVIADTVFHVEHSADPDLHRSAEHVETVLKPHLLRIQQLLSECPSGLEQAAKTLERENTLAGRSLTALITLIRLKGTEGCLRVCLGLEPPDIEI